MIMNHLRRMCDSLRECADYSMFMLMGRLTEKVFDAILEKSRTAPHTLWTISTYYTEGSRSEGGVVAIAATEEIAKAAVAQARDPSKSGLMQYIPEHLEVFIEEVPFYSSIDDVKIQDPR